MNTDKVWKYDFIIVLHSGHLLLLLSPRVVQNQSSIPDHVRF